MSYRVRFLDYDDIVHSNGNGRRGTEQRFARQRAHRRNVRKPGWLLLVRQKYVVRHLNRHGRNEIKNNYSKILQHAHYTIAQSKLMVSHFKHSYTNPNSTLYERSDVVSRLILLKYFYLLKVLG